MPIKSQAQRRKFAELLVEGKIKPEVFERWNREAGDAHLPERVTPTAKKKRRRRSARSPQARGQGKAEEAQGLTPPSIPGRVSRGDTTIDRARGLLRRSYRWTFTQGDLYEDHTSGEPRRAGRRLCSLRHVARGGRGPDPDHHLVGRGAAALPEGPRPGREAARDRRARALREGRGQGQGLRAGPPRARQHRRARPRSSSTPSSRRSRSPARCPRRSGSLICGVDAGAKGEPGAPEARASTKLVAAYPDDERAHNLLGAYHFGRQDYAAAVAEYKKATAINPAFSQPYNQMGYAYRFLGKYPEAEQAFKKYIELIPGDPNPYDSYAELLMKIGPLRGVDQELREGAGRRPQLRRLVRRHRQQPRVHGPARTRRAQPSRSLAAIARNDGEKRQAHFWTAMSYVHEGATDKAVAEIEKMAAIAEASGDLAAMSGDLQPDGQHPARGRTRGRGARRGTRSRWRPWRRPTCRPRSRTRRAAQHLFDEARVALARKDLAAAKAKAAAYAAGGGGQEDPVRGAAAATSWPGASPSRRSSYAVAVAELRAGQPAGPARRCTSSPWRCDGKGDSREAKQAAVQAADWNALSNTYGYVRGKARALATTKKN